MTTIAYRDGILAADGYTTSNDVVLSAKYKKIAKLNVKYRDDVLLYGGFCGYMHEMATFIHKMATEFVLDEVIPEHSSGIIVGAKYLWLMEGGAKGLTQIFDEPRAAGSGRDFAISAMALGLSAKEAVAHAIKFDIYSGGKIVVVNCRGEDV